MRLYILLFSILFFCFKAKSQTSTSYFVYAADSTRLAATVHLPAVFQKGDQLPTLVVYTRYWRGSVDKKGDPKNVMNGTDRYFSDNGYVIVKVDARGSGASFGTRVSEYSPQEVEDAHSIVNWIIDQHWSDGNIGAYGVSYEGTTAELLCAINHPSVKAVVPGWSDFDIYHSPVRAYGMLATGFIRKWGFYVNLLDQNRSLFLGESITPVKEELIKPALKEHKENPNIFKSVKGAEFRDSKVGGYNYIECSPINWKDSIEKSNVPMLVLTSWMDAGTAKGTLLRLQHFSNVQKIVLMATSHGGWSHASPYIVGKDLIVPTPTEDEQNQLQLDFFDYYLKGENTKVDEWPLVRYYNLGEEAFKTTDVWPVTGTVKETLYFNNENILSANSPSEADGKDQYKVDKSVTTGDKNRWTTQMGGAILNLDHREEMDERMLTYTTSPLTEDLQITGEILINLKLSSTHEDGGIFVYLEDVDSTGQSRYITEGGLRLFHRKMNIDSTYGYLHTYFENDASPMEPGKMEEIQFVLQPTSVLIKKGHSLRIAISGADKDTFDRIPKRGLPIYTVYRSETAPSFITLPVVR